MPWSMDPMRHAGSGPARDSLETLSSGTGAGGEITEPHVESKLPLSSLKHARKKGNEATGGPPVRWFVIKTENTQPRRGRKSPAAALDNTSMPQQRYTYSATALDSGCSTSSGHN